MTPEELSGIRQFAVRVARSAARRLRTLSARTTVRKDIRDVCTEADEEVERFIVAAINNAFPTHSTRSEEMGFVLRDGRYVWIIDPIDGTKHFVHDLPIFTVSIALRYEGEIVVGVVYDPNTDRAYHAHRGGGAMCDGTVLSVSRRTSLRESIVAVDLPKIDSIPEERRKKALMRLLMLTNSAYRMRAIGNGSLSLCYVALGGYDAYLDLTGEVKREDVAAASLIVEEAGGTFGKTGADDEFYVASNGRIHDEALALLNPWQFARRPWSG